MLFSRVLKYPDSDLKPPLALLVILQGILAIFCSVFSQIIQSPMFSWFFKHTYKQITHPADSCGPVQLIDFITAVELLAADSSFTANKNGVCCPHFQTFTLSMNVLKNIRLSKSAFNTAKEILRKRKEERAQISLAANFVHHWKISFCLFHGNIETARAGGKPMYCI